MKYELAKNYPRQKQFDFFRKYKDPRYHITFELDIAKLKAYAKERGYSLYTNLCYLFTKGMSQVEDFRYRLVDGEIVLYERLHIRMLVAAEDGTYADAATQYSDDIAEFNKWSEESRAKIKGNSGIDPDPEHENVVFYSSLPDVAFTGLTHPPENDPEKVVPKVTFGKFRPEGERLLIPVGLQVNHIFIDGKHLGELVKNVQTLYDAPV